MLTGICEFYEIDEDAKAQCEAEIQAYKKCIGEDAFQAEVDMYNALFPENPNDKLSQCGEYCKHLRSGKGYPGEYICYCSCPGHEHIIDADFNESEVI